VQAQGADAETARALLALARDFQQSGSVEAVQDIIAKNVVTGLQYIGQDSTTPIREQFQQELTAVRAQLARAVQAGEIADTYAAEDAQKAVTRAIEQTQTEKPLAEKITPHLEHLDTIVNKAATVAESVGKFQAVVIKLSPVVAVLKQLASFLVITGIQRNLTVIFHQPFTPSPDLVQLRTDYLTYLRDSYRYLDMKGIRQVQQVTQQLALTAVYVPLKAHAGHSAAGRVAGRQWSKEGAASSDMLAATALVRHAEPVPVEVALHTDPAVVVLGDPGAGKSTLLKVLALALAEHPDGLLSLLLPLNAYARRLRQQGALNLSQFLGEYYASRQHKLERVGELFHQTLTQHQAVVLLDGLDEVQVNCAHLVRLVQDFVDEHIPQPVDPPEPAVVSGDPPAVVRGNRVVVTSRIVGYDEAPLTRQQWRTYTLTDFTRADIEQFVTQWNLARSLDQYPVGESLHYEETIQVLAPLALWLRQENPTAGLVPQDQLEQWLTDYYHGEEWGLPRGEARQRGRAFLESVQRYSNLLLERGDRQYGFLHLTLEEILAAQGLVQRLDEHREEALALFRRYLPDPAWRETLQLAIGFVGVIQRRPREARAVLQELLTRKLPTKQVDRGQAVLFAGAALLDMGASNVSCAVALTIEQALVHTMQAAVCPIRTRRDAGDVLSRLGWTPEPDRQGGDLLLAPAGSEPTGLDAFRLVPGRGVWMSKYPVTNRQFARFVGAGGYYRRECWSDEGWAWRMGTYDSKAPKEYQTWLINRPPDKRDRPYWWDDRKWNSPLFPVVGITWFEAEAYARWLTEQLRHPSISKEAHEVWEGLKTGQLMARLPTETEWEAAIGSRGAYPWVTYFDPTRLNCAESWAGRRFADSDEWVKWISNDAESQREASTTAVTTYPQGVSQTGVWDGSGNVLEWMGNPYEPGGNTMVLRGGAWSLVLWNACVSYRDRAHPGTFNVHVGLRVVVAPGLQ